MANIGIPTKLLAESLGHVITVELKTGQVYRGKLFDCKHPISPPTALHPLALTVVWLVRLASLASAAEDSLSISLTNCTVTHRDGRVTQLDQVYIRGQSVRFYVVPDMLAQAPMYVICPC
jgi:small nuclear ribonucleoprotein D3